jgi:tetratricopeptide (TPR) repeat protein
MNLKRVILFILTFVSLFPVFLSLISSYQESQVQSNLELYATNLILRASELQLDTDRDNKKNSLNFLFGEQALVNAKEEYQEAKEIAEQNLKTLQEKNINSERLLTPVELEKIERAIALEEVAIDKLEINLGILKTQLNESEPAQELWNDAIARSQNNNLPEILTKTVVTLKNLWNDPKQISSDAEALIQNNLQGWFRYKALEKFYQTQNRLDALANLEQQEKEIALQVIFKLAIVNLLPWVGGIIGIGIIIYLIVQLFSQKQESLLLSLNNLTWETKWDGEIILQVIVGFFFVSQIVLPGIFPLSCRRIISLIFFD